MANFFTEGITITHSDLSRTDLGRSSGMFKISIRTSPAWRRRSASCGWAGAAAESNSAAMVKLKIFFIVFPSLDFECGPASDKDKPNLRQAKWVKSNLNHRDHLNCITSGGCRCVYQRGS